MCQTSKAAIALLSAAFAAQAYSLEARATAVNIDEFGVVRNGTTLFDDSFSQNTTLVGGSGTVLPPGTNFSDGTPASYRVIGSIPETTANNGQAQLNTANGLLIHQPPPNIPVIQETAAVLSTGTNASLPHALTSTSTFSAIALFDLAVPSVALGRYDVVLTNSTATPGRNIQMQLRETSTGPELRFIWLDQALGLNTVIGEMPLTAAELADPQVELGFLKDSASSDVVTAVYAFGSGNTLASFNGT
jgi:ABC-type amino acid transport substrate-binding protein